MTSPTEDILAKLAPESARDFQECFIEDPATGRIRFTAKGLAAFRSQFARVGIDIRRIRRREELRTEKEGNVKDEEVSRIKDKKRSA